MNTDCSTNKARAVSLLAATALVFASLLSGSFGAANAQEPSPFFRAFPDGNAVDGGNWPLGTSVHMAIDDPATEVAPDYEQDATVIVSPWDWISTYVRFDFDGVYDLKRGDVVTLSAGEISRYLIVPDLWVTTVDPAANIVAGVAEPDTLVHVFIGGDAELFVTADSEGVWLADFGGLFDLLPGMGGAAEVWFDEFNDSTIFNWSAPPLFSWRDEFDTDMLSPGWYWENGDSGEWSLAERPGFLRIYASDTPTSEGNLLLRPVDQGDFMIKTRVLFEPDTNFQFAGLVIWQDENNFLQFGRAFCDFPDVCVGNGIYFDYMGGGPWWVDGNFATQVDNPSEAYLRLERRGDMVKAFYSYEGITWYEIGTHWIPSDFQVNGVGLTASQDYNTPDSDIPADFDFFELTEGWGFLPEGFHDFDQGDVPSWACNAGGWAADPDDRAAHINVEIVVDHQTVAPLVAEEFRQDLLDAGVCVDGNCGFSTSLWGAISSYEPHRVDAWAQDNSTGEWVLLSNSAKTLTCRTYDIYAYDPLAGATKAITNLRDTDEYDPTWSPNGKKVAHDVVSGDSHGIYITDVKTGASQPLIGAQDGGNDADWSPNGKWIVFDRRWVGDPSLYIVPSTGGVPTLARSNAVRADWAPNGKRLVFQDTDGSIRTVPLDGGKGGETLISLNGADPAWSPDGDWIAYELNGDIWKVQVNIQGTVKGDPIQVTNLAAWGVGAPTWSTDSQTIVFNAGVSSDQDLWAVPAAGGEPTWLTGAPAYGDYGPDYWENRIAYASVSPEGQAARLWVAAYTHDLPAGYWSEGEHRYHFEAEWISGSETTPEIVFNVSSAAPSYAGYVLLRPGAVRAGVEGECPAIDAIRPDQPTRFLSGYVTDYAMTYPGALAFFESLTARAIWDDGLSADLVRHEIRPFSPDDWFQYVCTYTARE